VLKDFKEFLLKGNLVDTAVGIVIGLAFAAVVTALVGDLITPLIAAIGGTASFADLHFTINKSTFKYGDFLNAAITFITIAAVVFFLVIRPFNMLLDRFKSEPPTDPTVRACPHCLSAIPAEATVCAHCTRDVGPVAATA
jgi:large conductance mechanosensitive channel protein